MLSIMILLAVVNCFAFKLIDTEIYKSDPIWNEYLAYNQARSEVLDYRTEIPDEEHNYLKSIMDSGNYYDPEVFTSKKMLELASYRVHNNLNFKEMLVATKEILKSNLMDTTYRYYYILPIVLALLFLIFSKKRTCLIMAAIFGIIVYVYLFWIGRYTLFRVHFGLLLVICAFLCYMFTPGKLYEKTIGFINKKRFRVILSKAIMVVVCLTYLFLRIYPVMQTGLVDKFNDTSVKNKDPELYNLYYNAMDKMIENKNNLYLEELVWAGMAVGWSGNTYNISIHQTVKKDFFNNVVCLGGWDVFSKRSYETLLRYGITNPFKALIENDNVYFISMSSELPTGMSEYLKKNYGYKGECKLISENTPYYVFKFCS